MRHKPSKPKNPATTRFDFSAIEWSLPPAVAGLATLSDPPDWASTGAA